MTIENTIPATSAAEPAAAVAPIMVVPSPALPVAVTAATPDSPTAIVPVAGEGEGGEAKPAQADAAPAPYETFEVPEGFTLEADRLSVATKTFRDLNLTQEQAQALVALYPTLAKEDGEKFAIAFEEQRSQQIQQWGEDSKKEFGDKLQTILSDAQAGIQYAQTVRPAMLDTFNAEGWGNNPEALWAFAELGKLSRGSTMSGINGQSTGTQAAPAKTENRMYPNNP